MARLAIRQVIYTGNMYTFESPRMADGVVIVEGPNGSGKSTFADMIYYALGGTVSMFDPSSSEQHEEIMLRDSDNTISLLIDIDGVEYRLERRLKTNEVWIKDGQGHADLYAINRRGDRDILSDWILKVLKIRRCSSITAASMASSTLQTT